MVRLQLVLLTVLTSLSNWRWRWPSTQQPGLVSDWDVLTNILIFHSLYILAVDSIKSIKAALVPVTSDLFRSSHHPAQSGLVGNNYSLQPAGHERLQEGGDTFLQVTRRWQTVIISWTRQLTRSCRLTTVRLAVSLVPARLLALISPAERARSINIKTRWSLPWICRIRDFAMQVGTPSLPPLASDSQANCRVSNGAFSWLWCVAGTFNLYCTIIRKSNIW